MMIRKGELRDRGLGKLWHFRRTLAAGALGDGERPSEMTTCTDHSAQILVLDLPTFFVV